MLSRTPSCYRLSPRGFGRSSFLYSSMPCRSPRVGSSSTKGSGAPAIRQHGGLVRVEVLRSLREFLPSVPRTRSPCEKQSSKPRDGFSSSSSSSACGAPAFNTVEARLSAHPSGPDVALPVRNTPHRCDRWQSCGLVDGKPLLVLRLSWFLPFPPE